MPTDPRKTIQPGTEVHNAPTLPQQHAVRTAAPGEHVFDRQRTPVTNVEIMDRLGEVLSAQREMGKGFGRDLRALRLEVEAIKEDLENVKSDVGSARSTAKRSSKDALEAERETALLKLEMRSLSEKLEQQPKSIAQAGSQVNAELVGLVKDVRGKVTRWGALAAVACGIAAAGLQYVAGRGQAREQTAEIKQAVEQAAPREQRVIVVHADGQQQETAK